MRDPNKEELEIIDGFEKKVTNAKLVVAKAQASLRIAEADLLEAMQALKDECAVDNRAELDGLNSARWVHSITMQDGKRRQQFIVEAAQDKKVLPIKGAN